MTTKDHRLFLKDKRDLAVNDNLNGRFKNLNLNQNNQHSVEVVQSQNVLNHNKKISNYAKKTFNHRKIFAIFIENPFKRTAILTVSSDYSHINDSQTKENSTSFGKTNLCSSFANLNSQNDYGKKQESKEGKISNSKSSTLSIHIAAYENSIDATSGDPNNCKKDETNKKKEKNSSINSWKAIKESLKGSASVIDHPFEFQRQQQNQNNKPEVMQFKASQRLSNVNQKQQQQVQGLSDKMSTSTPPYPQSTLVLCKHTDNLYYEAKIIKAFQKDGEWIYRLHYQGWNSRYDENIKHSDTSLRFMEHTPDNIEMTKQQTETAKALSKSANKRKKPRLDEETEETQSVQSSKVEEPASQRPQIKRDPIPSRVLYIVQNVRNVPDLEKKTSVEDFFKKYLKKNKGKFGRLYPNHPAADELVTTLTNQLKLDFNMNLMTYLTQGEMKQCLTVFNQKRTAKGESEVTMEEMKELYEKHENRMELFKNPGINFADTYGVLHLVRFLKAGYNWYGSEVTEFEKFYVKLFYDLLCFAENFASEYEK